MPKDIIIFLFAAITLFFIVSCGNKKSAAPSDEIKVLALESYKTQLANEERDHYFVDVRTPKEVADGQIPGAINIDYKNANFKEKVSELDASKPMYLYCRSGNRSGKASKILVDLGFKEIYDLEGGWLVYSAEK